MIPDGEYRAVVDRFEDSLATLELSDGEERYNLVVGTEELPDDAQHVDAILTATVSEDALLDAVYHPDETARRRDEAQSRFDRLSRRPPEHGDAPDEDADG